MRPASTRRLALVTSLTLAFFGCSDASDTTDTSTAATTSTSTTSSAGGGGAGGSGGEGGATTERGLPTHCGPDAVEVAAAGPGSFVVKTEHYALTAETDAATAEDLGRLLEASWGGYLDYFVTAPTLAPGERLDVRYFATVEAWAASIKADGGVVPDGAGGLFLPSTRRAYLYDQHNPYFNQMLLVHEAAHQFHLLGRANGRSLPFWYVEGIAEYLGRHDWDGRCAKLGTVPLMNWDDMPEKALDDADDGGIDVPALTSGNGSPTRAAAWALVRYLELGAPGAQHDAFDVFRAGFDQGSTDPTTTFEALVGAPSSLVAPISAWLPTSQQRMRPIYTEWVHRSPTAVLAYSPGVFSLSVVKSNANHLEVVYDVPAAASWQVGVVLGFDDPQNFRAIVVGQDGALATFTATKGQALWYGAGKAPATSDAKQGTLAVDLGPGTKATVTVNGASSTHDTIFTPRVGLSLNDTRVLFRDLAFQ